MSDKDTSGAEQSAQETVALERAEKASSGKVRDAILPDLVEAMRQEGARVDVNVLLVQLTKKTDDPDAIIENAKKMLVLAQHFEETRLQNFLRTADAMIDVKHRDPDEIEKRKNNRMRRVLKGVVGGSSLLGLGGGIAGILLGGNIVVVGALLTVGCIGLAMSGPLAAGESLSSSDVVKIVRAIRPGKAEEEDDNRAPKRRPRR